MNAFEQALGFTLGLEGGYSNNPSDKGGTTMYGITEAVARKNSYTGPMEELPLNIIKQIYKSQYWDKMNLDEVAETSIPIAIKLFDAAVNIGPVKIGKFFQNAINILELRHKLRPPLIVDGVIGQDTIARLKMRELNIKHAGEEDLILKMLNAQQCVYYMELVQSDPSQTVFLKGWISKRIS